MWLCKRDLSRECEGKYRDCTDCVLDKIRAEIKAISIVGQVDEHTSFIRTGEHVKQMALDIIDKYTEEEIWEGIHAQVTAPKGTFDKIWNEAEDNDEI